MIYEPLRYHTTTFPVKELGAVGYSEYQLHYNLGADAVEVWARSDGRRVFDILKARIPMSALVELGAYIPRNHREPVFNEAPDGSKHVWSPGKKQWVPLADV